MLGKRGMGGKSVLDEWVNAAFRESDESIGQAILGGFVILALMRRGAELGCSVRVR